MDYPLTMEWEFCPDGVEVVELGPSAPGIGAVNYLRGEDRPEGAGRYFRYRTEARQRQTFTLKNLADAMILDFANAEGEEGLAAFFTQYGLPMARDADKGALVGPVVQYQELFQGIVRSLDDQAAASRDINLVLANIGLLQVSPRLDRFNGGLVLTYRPGNLYAYMMLEASYMTIGQVSSDACLNCGRLFVTGHRTRQNARRRFCSDRCRVAWNRAQKKEMIAEAVEAET